jgi:hypothetical protein
MANVGGRGWGGGVGGEGGGERGRDLRQIFSGEMVTALGAFPDDENYTKSNFLAPEPKPKHLSLLNRTNILMSDTAVKFQQPVSPTTNGTAVCARNFVSFIG